MALEILLIVIFINWILSPIAKDGGNTKILWIPIFTAVIISLVLGYLAGQYIHDNIFILKRLFAFSVSL